MAESAPAAPKAILRGHKAQVHAASFIRNNERLATGDADGYVVLWDLTIMRPRAVWRAHENSILGMRGWGRDKIITHGRDHKLIVWKIALHDEERLSAVLPLEDVPEPRPQPWILHLLEVNTMNFCSFSACPSSPEGGTIESSSASEILVSVPNTLASEAIDIYTIPTQARIHTIKPGQKNGMIMTLSILHLQGHLTLIAGFENGFASVHRLQPDGAWTMTYRAQTHSQPILSLDVHHSHDFFLTSAADSIIAKHPIPVEREEVSTAFDPSQRVVKEIEPQSNPAPSLLSQFLRNATPSPGAAVSRKTFKEWEHPLKVMNTKHSGQQGVRVRSDGRIFATAGWDSRIRVYSAKTLKELAVLSWHKVGAYAVAFSVIEESETQSSAASTDALPSGTSSTEDNGRKTSEAALILARGASQASASVVKGGGTSVKNRRIQLAKSAHWIAAGAKDGKVSLWDVY